MASLYANDRIVTRGNPGAFKIVSQVFRRIGCLLGNHDSTAKCLQVSFLDPNYQATLRANQCDSNGVDCDLHDVLVFHQIYTALTHKANSGYNLLLFHSY